MNSKRQCNECQEVFLVAYKTENLGKAITVAPAKHVKWVMDLPMAQLNLYKPSSGKPVVETRAIVHTAHWSTTSKLQTKIIIAGIE